MIFTFGSRATRKSLKNEEKNLIFDNEPKKTLNLVYNLIYGTKRK